MRKESPDYLDAGLLRGCLGIIGLFVVLLALVVVFSMWVSYNTCEASTISIGFPHYWSAWTGCMIKVNPTQWIPLENWRMVSP